ncbi:MAG: hypothetical protein ACRD2W_23490 [Acidimicrobiales bacterium]
MTDLPMPPLNEPFGPPGEDDEVVAAFAHDQLAPYSHLLHVEGPVLLAGRDWAVALRVGPRSFLVNHDMPADLHRAKIVVEDVFRSDGLEMFDEETLYGTSVGVQYVGLRYTTWDLWGADIETAFADLRLKAAGGEDELGFGIT